MSGSHRSPDDLLQDICDGTIFNDNPMLHDDERALQIIGYYDEFTLTNPLMSRAKQHKIGSVCMNTCACSIDTIFHQRRSIFYAGEFGSSPTFQIGSY